MTLEEITASIRHGLRGVLRFSGRERRAQFWPYAIFVALVAYAASTMLALPMIFDMMARIVESADQSRAGGAGLPPEAIEAAVLGMGEDVGTLQWGTVIVEAVAVALLAAAVVRRLHDTGWRGWWGWLPVPFMAAAVASMPVAMGVATGSHGLSGLESFLYVSGMLFWVALVPLCLLLARAGEEGPNRFGPPPPPDDLRA